MKKIIIILLSALSLTAFAQQKKVAVYVAGEQSGISKVLGDQLVAAFAKSGKYTAVERTSSFLAELGKEQNYQRSGAVSDNDIARLGDQFGVQYVCVADMSDVFGEKYISARLINVETAEIVNTHNVSGEMTTMDACLKMAGEIAENLSKGTFAEQAAEEKRKAEAERARKEELSKQGWVDMALPSGTYWKSSNESGFYSFNQAMGSFGSKLPSKRQWEELKSYCSWTWAGSGFKVVASNGNSIYLPAEGYKKCSGDVNYRMYGNLGWYWVYQDSYSDMVTSFYVGKNDYNGYTNDFSSAERCHGYSVRLVLKE